MLGIVFGRGGSGGGTGGVLGDVGNGGVRVQSGFGGGLETLEFGLLVGGQTGRGGAALEEGGGVAGRGRESGEAREGAGEGEEAAGHFVCRCWC